MVVQIIFLILSGKGGVGKPINRFLPTIPKYLNNNIASKFEEEMNTQALV
jgi:hypothetical protein